MHTQAQTQAMIALLVGVAVAVLFSFAVGLVTARGVGVLLSSIRSVGKGEGLRPPPEARKRTCMPDEFDEMQEVSAFVRLPSHARARAASRSSG